MPNPGTSSPEGGGLPALLERELEQRRGRAPEPGEIFVLSETAELPVEWALLEARPRAFLAIPVDTQPLAGSRDFALGAHVLSGPLSLRCGHAVEIAASRLRPELRTGLLDPHSLAAARGLQSALAAGTAEPDPLGEEVDRDPEYRDWVEEVLDPARAVMAGLGAGSEPEALQGAVLPFENRPARRTDPRREGSGLRRALPWLVAACLAIGLGWQRSELHEVRRMNEAILAPQIDEESLDLPPGTVRGEKEWKLPPAKGLPGERLRFAGFVPVDTVGPIEIVLRRNEQELARGPVETEVPSAAWSIAILRSKVPPGHYRIDLQSAGGKVLASWDIRVVETSSEP